MHSQHYELRLRDNFSISSLLKAREPVWTQYGNILFIRNILFGFIRLGSDSRRLFSGDRKPRCIYRRKCVGKFHTRMRFTSTHIPLKCKWPRRRRFGLLATLRPRPWRKKGDTRAEIVTAEQARNRPDIKYEIAREFSRRFLHIQSERISRPVKMSYRQCVSQCDELSKIHPALLILRARPNAAQRWHFSSNSTPVSFESRDNDVRESSLSSCATTDSSRRSFNVLCSVRSARTDW